MRRAVPSVFVCAAIACSFLAVALPQRRAEAGQTAADCVTLLQEGQDKSVSIDVNNACERAVSCQVHWTLTCEDVDGKVARRTVGSSQFALQSSASSHIVASAESCKWGWAIDDLTWNCNPR